ncbi:MAG: DNA replication/repair protein RecF [Gammaproteobacteria bacterium]|nr:DNA replication/repair protein RecF [Gammaproteobacteria bacterium]
MSLSRLTVQHVRNLQDVSLSPSSGLNLIVGANASGKTSLLEAIFLLGMGRSFRSINIRHVIAQGKDALTVFGTVDQKGRSINLGVEKHRERTRIRIAGEWVKSAASLAHHLPLQLITPDSHKLIEQGPRYRRQYMDWGVFHVEQSFYPNWRRFQRALKQRNAGLRRGLSTQAMQAWNQELISAVGVIDRLRRAYIGDLLPLAKQRIQELTDLEAVEISYQSGWKQGMEYAEYLAKSQEKDQEAGYTRYGAQRAELALRVEGMPAAERVSRGQQKLLASALRLAQIEHLRQSRGIRTVLLVDDLPAELDESRRGRFLEALRQLDTQVFVTATEASLISNREQWSDQKMFHVEHGSVAEMV